MRKVLILQVCIFVFAILFVSCNDNKAMDNKKQSGVSTKYKSEFEGRYYNNKDKKDKKDKTCLILRNDTLYLYLFDKQNTLLNNTYYVLAVCSETDTVEYIGFLGKIYGYVMSNKIQFKDNKIILTLLQKPDKTKLSEENGWLYELIKKVLESANKDKKMYEWVYKSNNTSFGDATVINSFWDVLEKAIEESKRTYRK